tara:strand:- start:1328 stop:2053 length:726 start_codon:yes stop_codon:yes gene_type:complete
MASKDDRPPEEIEANVKKLNAEALAAEAEARKTTAEAREAECKAQDAELRLERTKRDFKIKWAEDIDNHLYRFNGSVSSDSVNSCIKSLTHWSRIDPKCDIEIVFSSPGGSIIPGFELFDFIQTLRDAGHHITTGSLGYAASMAGILLQAGDTRWIGHQSWMMIHRAAFGAYGKTFEIEDEVKFVQRIEKRIIDIFTARSTLTKQKIKRNWDRKDWWISADECLEMNLVDDIRGRMPEFEA